MGISSKILRFFLTEDPADPSAPFMQALRVWASALLAPLGPDLHFAVGGLLAREASRRWSRCALFMVALLIAAGWRTRGGRQRAARHHRLRSMRGSAASAQWHRSRQSWRCSSVRGGFGDYMVAWISVIGVMKNIATFAGGMRCSR